MSIYFVRHGETDWNKKGIMQGKSDIPLNERGREQAYLTKEKLKEVEIKKIYCSPLLRAKETAEIINQNYDLSIIYDERLEEISFGIQEGKELGDVVMSDIWTISDQAFFQDGEATKTFYQRVESFLNEIGEEAQKNEILIVAHGGVSIPYHCYFHGYDHDLSTFLLRNCEVNHQNGSGYKSNLK